MALFCGVRFVFVTARRFFCILLILLEKSGVIVIRIFFGKTPYGKSRRNKLFDQKHLFLIYIFFQAYRLPVQRGRADALIQTGLPEPQTTRLTAYVYYAMRGKRNKHKRNSKSRRTQNA